MNPAYKSFLAYERQLKPCPFCGSKATLYQTYCYGAKCTAEKCKVHPNTMACDSPEEAIEVWNKRPKTESEGV